MPGKIVRCGAISKNWRPSDSIAPQLGVGACTPSPKKLKPASATMADAIPNVASTMIGAMMFGNR